MGSHIQKPGLIQCGGSVVCPSRAFEMSIVYIFVQPSTSLSSCYLSYLGQDEEANGGHEQKRWHQMSPDARCSNTCTLLLCKVTHPPNCVAIVKRAIVTPFYSNLKHTYQYHGETKCVGNKNPIRRENWSWGGVYWAQTILPKAYPAHASSKL